jgi:FGGY-family pentulose kinase
LSDPVVVAVDVGSTSARAGVFDARGRRLARAFHSFAVAHPLPDHAEHSSDDIWRAVCSATHEAVRSADVAAERVVGLAFDATCSLTLLGADGRPVTASTTGSDKWNVVMWADHRAIAEAAEITSTGHRALRYVGGTMSPEMELPKLLWLKRHLPDAWQRYGLALDLADFLAWRATGRIAVSACTITCKWAYLNHEDRGWQADLLAAIGLADLPVRSSLPQRAQAIGSIAGTLTSAAAADLGLTTQCTVGVGLIDAHAGGLGLLGGYDAQALNTRLAMIAGTSTCHMAVALEPRHVPGVWGPYFDAMIPGLWLNEGGQAATGALLDHILDWHSEGRALGASAHRRVLARIDELERAEGLAVARGLCVLPDFHGNRSPLANPLSRGAIDGLTLDSSFDSLARLYYATAVAIALGTRHIVDTLNAHGYAIRHLHLTGGHVANPLLVRLYADATGCTVELPAEEDSVLLGTAAVAAAAAGLHPSLAAAASAMAVPGKSIEPDRASAAHFGREYRKLLLMQEHQRALSDIR